MECSFPIRINFLTSRSPPCADLSIFIPMMPSLSSTDFGTYFVFLFSWSLTTRRSRGGGVEHLSFLLSDWVVGGDSGFGAWCTALHRVRVVVIVSLDPPPALLNSDAAAVICHWFFGVVVAYVIVPWCLGVQWYIVAVFRLNEGSRSCFAWRHWQRRSDRNCFEKLRWPKWFHRLIPWPCTNLCGRGLSRSVCAVCCVWSCFRIMKSGALYLLL